ncbi:hypothetical protein AURDEDRAFT_145415 [Auricularia subglabra TFB-10046 SS5]|nr:hypothetical protein AURDEDRAFT_145415 [Auricularia subglabra TFB-10046 SS5]
MYHTFTGQNSLCQPERAKAPIKRRRGEPAALWNARLYEALIDGSKPGDIDWEEMRRIALSEYDKTRDTLDQWRMDSVALLQGVFRRAESTIPHPDELRSAGGDVGAFVQLNLCAAWRSRLHLMQIAHAHWYRSAALFEELASRGLTTSTAIERACKTDASLKWRLLSVQFLSQTYTSLHWSLACQIVATDSTFTKYIEVHRDNQGRLHMLINNAACRPLSPGAIESKVAHLFTDVQGGPAAAFDVLKTHFEAHPEDRKKFSESAWQVLGDVAVSTKFTMMMLHSSFGKKLFKMADDAATLIGPDRDLFEREFLFMDARVLRAMPDTSPSGVGLSQGVKLCNSLVGKLVDAWMAVVFVEAMNPRDLMQMAVLLLGMRGMQSGSHSAVTRDEEVAVFGDSILRSIVDGRWQACDEWEWERAQELDPKGPRGQGLVARTFGLYDPEDPHRPFCRDPEEETSDDEGATVPKSTPAPAPPPEYEQTIPVADPTESVAQSGHAAAREAVESAPKEKPKTRGEPTLAVVEADLQDATKGVLPEAEDEAEEYPEVLPSSFKLGKKHLLVFRQILGYKKQTADGGEAMPKAGVVRWEHFEKAMKRIGFEVVQTTGSSVRFDPPARTARPITFHRPHPESILPPVMQKWMRNRLRRYYGWTAQTFEYDPTLTNAATA